MKRFNGETSQNVPTLLLTDRGVLLGAKIRNRQREINLTFIFP